VNKSKKSNPAIAFAENIYQSWLYLCREQSLDKYWVSRYTRWVGEMKIKGRQKTRDHTWWSPIKNL